MTVRALRDGGSGSVLVVGLVGGVIAVLVIALPLYMVLAARQSVAGAADAAALAAADAASGLVAGYPCETAESVALGNAASVASCVVDGLVVTVSVSRIILGIPVSATATAGPPTTAMD